MKIKDLKQQEKIRKAILNAKARIDQMMLANQSILVYDLQKEHYEGFEYNLKINLETILDYDYQEQVIDFLKKQRLIHHRRSKLTLEVFEANEEEIIGFILNETELDSQIRDYYEAWLVDGWFLNLLEKKGELIIDYKAQEQWWGRKCTGQRYDLDYVVQEITKEVAAEFASSSVFEIENYLKTTNQTTFNFI